MLCLDQTTRKWTKKHVFLIAKENKISRSRSTKRCARVLFSYLKFTLTETFLQQRWAYLGLADNYKLSFATMKSMCAQSLQSCPTLWDPMDCSNPGSSVHGILQTWILEWVAISFSRGSSRPRDQTQVYFISFIGRLILYHQCHVQSPQMNHI